MQANLILKPCYSFLQFEADGKKSIRSLQGLRRDSQIIYTGSFETTNRSKCAHIVKLIT